MQVYTREKSHYFCGHWNGSPLEIGDSTLLRDVPESEARHFHEFFEYYVALEGEAELEVEGEAVALRAGSVVMVHPRESHRISWVHPELGARWIVVKQESRPKGKRLVSSDGT
jgi:mannose-6-phosphate isomerase-like protein (cupin superfamily)